MQVDRSIITGNITVNAQRNVPFFWFDGFAVDDRWHRVVKPESASIWCAALAEIRCQHQLERSKLWIGTQLHGIHAALEIFQRPSGEERHVIFGKKIVHEY